MRLLAAACAMAAVALSSVPAHAQGIDPALAAETWHVSEIGGTPAAFAETLQFGDHRVAGRSACNRFSAGVRQTGQKLEIGEPVATRMFCQGRMDEERRYFTALHAVSSYSLADGFLSLNDAGGKTLLKLKK